MAEHVSITPSALQDALVSKVVEVRAEPDYAWSGGRFNHMTDAAGRPVVRVAVANCGLETDIWAGLRSPSNVGLHPLGLRDIWAFYAANDVRNTRRDGSPNPLAMPETFEEASEHFGRAVFISALLPVNPAVYAAYAERIVAGERDPLDSFVKATRRDRGDPEPVPEQARPVAAGARARGRAHDRRPGLGGGRPHPAEYQKGRYHGPANKLFPRTARRCSPA